MNTKMKREVVQCGMVMWKEVSQGPSEPGNPMREVPARLILTKDQVTIQVHVSNADLVVSTVAITQADSTLELALRTVNVPKAKEGLGFSIKGGTENGQHLPIIISKILPDMSAAKTGQVLTGDVIVEVDGIPTEGKSHDEVVQMLKGSSGEHVTLTLRRDNPAGAGGLIPGGPTDVTGTLYKGVLKSPTDDRQQLDDDLESNAWNVVNRTRLHMAIISRYLWGTDKLRNNAFEVRSLEGRSSGIVHCEDKKALEQWIQKIESHIFDLNKRSIRISNKYRHNLEKITYIGWLEERMPDGYFEDPKVKWERRFVILKGPHLCFFESPPLSAEELDKCTSLYKVYETALKTAIRPIDRRDHAFCIDTAHEAVHYLSVHSRDQLQRFECAYYNCVYKAIIALQARTFACSVDDRSAGLVLDIRNGISCYDISTKRYAWQYRFGQLDSSADDGKMRIQLSFKADPMDTAMVSDVVETRNIQCDSVLTLVFTLHAFYITKIMGVDPEYLQNLPLS